MTFPQIIFFLSTFSDQLPTLVILRPKTEVLFGFHFLVSLFYTCALVLPEVKGCPWLSQDPVGTLNLLIPSGKANCLLHREGHEFLPYRCCKAACPSPVLCVSTEVLGSSFSCAREAEAETVSTAWQCWPLSQFRCITYGGWFTDEV